MNLNGNAKDVMNTLYQNYKLFTEYQERMNRAWGVFYCIECQELHSTEEKVRGHFLCKTAHKEREKERLREYRRKKALTK